MTAFHPIRFGKYLLLNKIATGGMAELYLAKITGVKGFEKLIAIKKILPHLAVQDKLIGTFIDEAKLAAYLHHPNIVQIYDFGSIEGAYFIAMEYLSGKDLWIINEQAKRKNLPLSIEHDLYITSRICSALDYAHTLQDFHGNSLNIIHRDIGPQNIFLTYDGQIKIIDFGIAKAATQNTTTQEGSLKGKISYMSPEQARGDTIDHRSDIFSIGIVLYELVTGRKMYDGDTVQAYSKAREARFEPAEKIRKDLHPGISKILDRALAKEPAQRYKSADQMRVHIDALSLALSFRTGDRSLARYMMQLFSDEAKADAIDVRNALLVDKSEPDEPENTGPIPSTETLPVDNKGLIQTKEKPFRGIYAAVALIIIVTVVFLGVYYLDIGDNSPSAALPGRPEGAPAPAPYTAEDLEQLDQGKALIHDAQYEEAIILFKQLSTDNPSLKPLLAEPYAKALLEQAAQMLNAAPDKSKELLLKSVTIDPENAHSHYLLGKLYAAQNDTVSAVPLYQRAIELDPTMAAAYFNLGYVYAVNKEYDKAETMYLRVTELTPPYVDEALFNLAMVQSKLDRHALSITNLERALETNPDNEQARRALDKLQKKNGLKK